jgi:hypothetical protein
MAWTVLSSPNARRLAVTSMPAVTITRNSCLVFIFTFSEKRHPRAFIFTLLRRHVFPTNFLATHFMVRRNSLRVGIPARPGTMPPSGS